MLINQKKSDSQECLVSDDRLDVFSDCVDNKYRPKKYVVKYDPDASFSFSIPTHRKLLNKISKKFVMYSSSESVLTRSVAEDMAKNLCDIIEYPKYKYTVISESIHNRFSSEKISTDLLFRIVLFIGGNLQIIREDSVIPPGVSTAPVWGSVIVTSVKDSDSYPGKVIILKVVYGIYSGSYITRYFSNKYIKYILREIGFPKYVSNSPEDIFDTRWSVLIHNTHGRVELLKFTVSTSQKKYNKNLSKHRYQTRPCIYNKYLTCVACPRGLDMCEFALKNKTRRKQCKDIQ